MPPATVRVLASCHLPRVSHQSCLSANDNGDNEMKPETLHRSPRLGDSWWSGSDHKEIVEGGILMRHIQMMSLFLLSIPALEVHR